MIPTTLFALGPRRAPSPNRFLPRLQIIAALLLAGSVGPVPAQTSPPPTLFLIGDSTVRNGNGKGVDSMWGWGSLIGAHFDITKIRVENRAIGGRSSRTFFAEGRWAEVLTQIHPGDFVMMQFGHNDGSALTGDRGRGSLKSNGEEMQTITNNAGKVETVHTYGWYLRKYIADAKAKGATPIVVSQIPRNIWKDGKVVRESNGYGKFAREAAEQGGAAFLDLNEIVATRYEQIGEPTVRETFFKPTDHTHTTLAGAKLNAAAVVEGLRAFATQTVGDDVRSRPAGGASGGMTPNVVAYKAASALAAFLLPPESAPPKKRFSHLGSQAADGPEQLGLFRHHRYRGANQGADGIQSKRSASNLFSVNEIQ